MSSGRLHLSQLETSDAFLPWEFRRDILYVAWTSVIDAQLLLQRKRKDYERIQFSLIDPSWKG